MRRVPLACLIVGWLALTVWSAARADEMVPTISVLYDRPAPLEAEVRGLGIVQLELREEGQRGGLWWASLAVLADVGPSYEIRVRARDGSTVTAWSPWRVLAGPPAETCDGPEDDGAIGLDDVWWVLRTVGQPGRVCLE